MRNVAVIADGLWAGAKSGEYLPAGQSQPAVPQDEHRSTLVSAVNELFKELRSIRSAWRQAWPDKETYQASKRQWYQAFTEAGVCAPGQIAFGMSQARKQPGDFIPSPGQFIEWCKPTPELLGLPPLDRAYREACRNAHPGMAGIAEWSHNAVYHAATESGFGNLNTLPQDVSRRLFERNYQIAVRALVTGEPLRKMPLALPPKIPTKSQPQVGQNALAALRASRSKTQ
jgi:hypothetical protein